VRTLIRVDTAVQPQAAYSQGIVASGIFLFVSGQGPLDPATGQVVAGDFGAQARRTFANVQCIVEGARGNLADTVKVNVYLRNIAHFAEMNRIYREFFSEPWPARTTVQSELTEAEIEVDAIVVLPENWS
jgi:2-iminobutanoate/2-iminopropanoate deaminase